MATTKKKNEDIIKLATERFSQAIDAESDNRARAVEDIRFVDLDEQWDQQTRNDRELNGRPCMVINKCNGVVKQISNEARQSKPRIKVRPSNDKANVETAELLSGLVRNIENKSDADSAYDTGIDQAIKGGWGYWRVVGEYCDDDVFEQDLFIRRIVNQFSVYLDPAAKEADKSDAGWGFVTDVITKREFESQYPKEDRIEWSEQGAGEGNGDWFTEDGIRLAEYYYKEPVTKTLWMTKTVVNGEDDYDTIEADDQKVVEQDGKKFFYTELAKEEPDEDEQSAGAGEGGMQAGMPTGMQETALPGMMPEQGMMQQPMQPQMPVQPSFTVTEIIKERTVKSHKVMWCKLGGNVILEGPTEQKGKYIPIVACIGDESFIEGEPVYKSAFFHAKDAQRVYNWAESNSVETLALGPKQPYIGTPAMFDGHEKEWDNANRTPKMRLEANFDNGALPQRQPLTITDNGSLQQMMQAADDIKSTTGLFDPSMGNSSSASSGKQELILQQKGDTSTYHFKDNQRRAIAFTGRILIDLIPYYYDTERVVRILGQDGKEDFQTINKRVPDPMAPGGYRVTNDLSVGSYDIVTDTGPAYLTKRMEAADGMIQFMSVAPNTAPVVLPRIAKNLDWPDADEIGEELGNIFNPPQPQGPSPEQQMMMQAEQIRQQGEQAKTQLAIQDGQLKMQQGMQKLEQGQIAMAQSVADLERTKIETTGEEISNAQAMIEIRESNTKTREDIETIKRALGIGVNDGR